MISIEIVRKFLNSKPSINRTQLEKEAGIPATTIYKALEGVQPFSTKHLEKLEVVMRNYGYSEVMFSKARSISLINHKGGVGKTTTTINLGKALTLLGYKVLMVDMDSQGNLSQCFGVHNPEKQVIESLITKDSLPIVEIAENLHLSPSDIKMATYEIKLITEVGSEMRLARKIQAFTDQYDFILFDCPPSLGVMTISALNASTECIIPIQPESSAFNGVRNLIEKIDNVKEYTNLTLKVRGFLFTMVHPNQTIHQAVMENVAETYPTIPIFKSMIESQTVIKQSQYLNEDIFIFDNKSKAAKQYLELAKEVASIEK
ncbi:MAG: AAA family ATPase [Spirosomaceae bacterium]|jgi:chromosome partitioning protein|nr:AAA family ATPase [Spirosomataceae bacterium]